MTLLLSALRSLNIAFLLLHEYIFCNENARKAFCFSIILCFHILIVVFALSSKSTKKNLKEEFISLKFLHSVPLQINLSEPKKPNVSSFAKAIKIENINLTALEFAEDIPSVPAVSSDTNQNGTVIFDPRLRKKLSENSMHMVESKSQKLKEWTNLAGDIFVEVGDGKCLKSMSSMNSGGRGTAWSLPFKCGKDGGEKMMDNINADLASRKKSKY